MMHYKFEELTKEQQVVAINTYGNEANDPMMVFNVAGNTIMFMSKQSEL